MLLKYFSHFKLLPVSSKRTSATGNSCSTNLITC